MARINVVYLITSIAACVVTLSHVASANTVPASALNAPSEFRFFSYSELSEFPAIANKSNLPQAHQIDKPPTASNQLTGTEGADLPGTEALGNWLNSDSLTADANELIDAIRNARIHGLNPQAYQLSEINTATRKFARYIARSSHPRTAQRANIANNEIALRFQLNTLFDASFMKLARHLAQGVVDGRDLQKRLYRDPPQLDAFMLLLAVNNGELSVSEALASVTPSHPGYQRLTKTMSDLLSERAAGASRTKIPTPEETLANTQTDHKHLLWNRLIETGDLASAAVTGDDIDDELLKSAVKSFQAKRGLEQDGNAGVVTRAALNASAADDIEAVAMSLERFRWLPRDLGERHLFINIPDFQVNLIDNYHTTLSMPVVVGKHEHQTPSFSRQMSYMEYNPTWTVPGSIARKKLIPKELESPGYLVRNNFDFLKVVDQQLVKVPASSVTRDDLNTEKFPFVLRQRSGAGNALGRMKFMMPNKYAIYLHDTPDKSLFSLTDRAHSHGCVRLSDPNALAQALMLGDGYTQSSIDESMQSQKTHKIEFRQPIPTHMVYMTAWVDENQVLQTRPDVYDNDKKLLDALRESDTLLGAMNTQLLGQAGKWNKRPVY